MNNEYRKIIEEADIRDTAEGREQLIIKLHRERDEAREALEVAHKILWTAKGLMVVGDDFRFDAALAYAKVGAYLARSQSRTAGEQP